MKSFGVLILFATLGAALAFVTQCTYPGAAWVATLTHDTPDARISAYVAAVARGSEEDALAVWPGPSTAGSGGARPLRAASAPFAGGVEAAEQARQALAKSFAARRSQVTHELAASGVHAEARVRDRQWWTLCCDPRPIERGEHASGLIATVELTDGTGAVKPYVFRLRARNLDPIWDGLPARDWQIADVFPASEVPDYFTRSPWRG